MVHPQTPPRILVFDMDGVLWAMEDPIPHAADCLAELRQRGVQIRFLTNNSSRTRADYVRKLNRMGIAGAEDEVMTSAYATAQVLVGEGAVGMRVYVVGEAGLRSELADAGMELVSGDADRIDYVVVGWDRQFTYAKLAEAHRAIVELGARFIATNRDATYPDAGGRTLPGGGSIVASIATSTGLMPRTIGKPERDALDLVLDAAGASLSDCLVIGDRLDTDIQLGVRAGARTGLVLTGVSTLAEVNALPESDRPTFVWPDLSGLAITFWPPQEDSIV